MLPVIVTGRRVICDDYIGAEFANLQDHTAQSFFVSPEPEGFFARLRETKIFQSEKVRVRSLNLSRRHRLVRANRAHLLIQLRTNCVLPTFTISGKQTD